MGTDPERAGRTTHSLQMTFTISKRFTFEAAHSLPHLPEGHKCRNVHGHSYAVEVFCTGPLDASGMVVDYGRLSAAMEPILKQLDHANLNDVLPCVTTAECIAQWIMEQLDLSAELPTAIVTAVEVRETKKTCARVSRTKTPRGEADDPDPYHGVGGRKGWAQ